MDYFRRPSRKIDVELVGFRVPGGSVFENNDTVTLRGYPDLTK
jgi:hypothetical protein